MNDTFDTIESTFDAADWGFDSDVPGGFEGAFLILEPYNPYRKRKTREELLREEVEAMEFFFRMKNQR